MLELEYKVLKVKARSNGHLITVNVSWTIGWWIWKQRKSQEVRFQTHDGLQWYFAGGQVMKGRPDNTAELKLHGALQSYLSRTQDARTIDGTQR